MRGRTGALWLVLSGLPAGCSGEAVEPVRTPAEVTSTRSAVPLAEPEFPAPLRSVRPGSKYSSTAAMVMDHEVLSDPRTVRIFVALSDLGARVCGEQVTETADEVRVSIRLCVDKESGTPEMRIGMLEVGYLDIRLGEPVGARELVDASGRTLPRPVRPTGIPPATVGPGD